jgi:hypothetical protein
MGVVGAFAPPSSSSFISSKTSALSSPLWLPTATTKTAGITTLPYNNQLAMLPSSSIQIVEESSSTNTILYTILHTPTLWSVLAMISIVALLVLWEETVHNVRHNTPKAIVPVIDSMLAEVGGLG